MSTWFTADLHFGHRLVAGHRGFLTEGGPNTMAHDLTLIDRWCQVVRSDDHVWVLGDIAVSSPTRALGIIGDLPGIKHLIAGNHDGCHPMHRNSHKMLRLYMQVFTSVQPFARRRINGEEVLLSHFPYDKDRHEVRYTQYRLRDEGRWLLHGHTHQADQRREGREIHVGVDAWDLAPVHLNTIAELMNEEQP